MKLFLKILLFPVWAVSLVILGLAIVGVKVILGIYNICRGFFVLLCGILIAAAICFHWSYAEMAFVASLWAVSLVILVMGVFAEVFLETMWKSVGRMIYN